jgi:hypothetical protein
MSAYVKKRTGVPLGASGSMTNMLKRSLGAGSFYLFWRYWNPIWGYYLSRNVMKPLGNFLPLWLVTLLTFSVSGGLHDLALSLVKWKFIFFFTPWFALMGVAVLLTKTFNISYSTYPWPIRMSFNLAFVVGCLMLAIILEMKI